MLIKYVDDVNFVAIMTKLGNRWNENMTELVWSQENLDNDNMNNKTEDKLTMELIHQAANKSIEYLDLTLNTPDKNKNNKVPMLDLQTWLEPMIDSEGNQYQQLMYEYYEKPVTSDRVTDAKSAYTWRNKIMSLSMETFRRHRNCCNQTCPTTRVKILEKFLRKMKKSGYSKKIRENIIRSGTIYFYRRTRIQYQGGPPVNRRKTDKIVARRRLKLGASEKWFSCHRDRVKESVRKEMSWMRQQTNTTTTNQHKTRTDNPLHTTTQDQNNTRHGRFTRHNTCNQQTTNTHHHTNQTPHKEHTQTESTLTVPHTQDSKLSRQIQEAKDQISRATMTKRTRVIEKGGTKLVNLLTRTDPGQKERFCGRDECKNCESRMRISDTRKVGRPTSGQFSSTCSELVAFGHLDSCMDSCMESCIVRDHSC